MLTKLWRWGEIFINYTFPPPLKHVSLLLEGFGSGDIISIGYFAIEVHMDEHEFNATAYVINFSRMIIPFIIGRDVIFQRKIICDQNGISLLKLARHH